MLKTLRAITAYLLILLLSVPPAFAQNMSIAQPVSLFEPPVLKGITVFPQNPFFFSFIVDRGQEALNDQQLKAQGEILVKYFFGALTIPEKEAWVNLSPYEKDRIIPDNLGQTDMGKVMLEQDYQLKQRAAALTDPSTDLGKKYWESVDRSQSSAKQLTQRSGDTKKFTNKVWIVPDGAKVVEKKGTVYILESKLKVLMEEDYFFANGQNKDNHPEQPSTRIFRELILPQLEKEVNSSKTFAPTRQVFQSVILATWYKQALKQSLLGQVYADRSKIAGIVTDEKNIKEKVYEQYLNAFKKGAYDSIKEEVSPEGDIIPRKYFSGGMRIEDVNLTVSAAVVDVKRANADLREKGTRLSAMGVQATETKEEQLVASAPLGPTQSWEDLRFSTTFKDAMIAAVAKLAPTFQGRSYAYLTNIGKAANLFEQSGYTVSDTVRFWAEAEAAIKSQYNGDVFKANQAVAAVADFMLERFSAPKAPETAERSFPPFSEVQGEIFGKVEDLKKASAAVIVTDNNSYVVDNVKVLNWIYFEVSNSDIQSLIREVRAFIQTQQVKVASGEFSVPLTMTFDESLPEKEVVYSPATGQIVIPKGAVIHPYSKDTRIVPQQLDEDFWYGRQRRISVASSPEGEANRDDLGDVKKKDPNPRMLNGELPLYENVLRDLILANTSTEANDPLAKLVTLSPKYPGLMRESILATAILNVFGSKSKAWIEYARLNGIFFNGGQQKTSSLDIVDYDLLIDVLNHQPARVVENDKIEYLENPMFEAVKNEILSLPDPQNTRGKLTASSQADEWPRTASITAEQVQQIWARVEADELEGNGFFKKILRNYIVGLLRGEMSYSVAEHRIILQRLKIAELAARDLKVIIDTKAVERLEEATLSVFQEALRKAIPVVLLYGPEGLIERLNLNAPDQSANQIFVRQFVNDVVQAQLRETDLGVAIDLTRENPVSLYDYLPVLLQIAALTEFKVTSAETASAPVETNKSYGGINFDPALLNLQIKRDGNGVPLPLPQQDLQHINIPGIFPVIINIQPLNPGALPLFSEAPLENRVALKS